MKRRTLLKGIGTTGLVAGVGVAAAGDVDTSTHLDCDVTCCEECDDDCDVCDCEEWCTRLK